MGGNEYAFSCTVTAFLAVKITQISFFSFFNGIYEPGHLKIMQHYDVVHDI